MTADANAKLKRQFGGMKLKALNLMIAISEPLMDDLDVKAF
jgi:hypothetical protein